MSLTNEHQFIRPATHHMRCNHQVMAAPGWVIRLSVVEIMHIGAHAPVDCITHDLRSRKGIRGSSTALSR